MEEQTHPLEQKRRLLMLLEERVGPGERFASVLKSYRAEIGRRIGGILPTVADLQALRGCMRGAGDLMHEIVDAHPAAMYGWHFGMPATNNAQHTYGILCDIAYDLSWAIVMHEDQTAAHAPLLIH